MPIYFLKNRIKKEREKENNSQYGIGSPKKPPLISQRNLIDYSPDIAVFFRGVPFRRQGESSTKQYLGIALRIEYHFQRSGASHLLQT